MKVLHIGQMIGGLGIYIRNTINYSSDEFEFVIVHGNADNSKPVIKDGKAVKEYTISLYRELNPLKDLKGLIQVIRIIRKEKPDIIHCHSAKGGFIGRMAGFLTRTKTFYTPHAFSFLSTQNKIKKQIYLVLEKMAKLNSFLLACSESERELGMRQVHYKEKRAYVWSNSVPDAQTVRPSGLNESSPYICYVGRPSYQKNPFFLVNVIREVHKACPNIRFYILGVGYYSPDLEQMKRMIAQYQLGNTVELFPWLSHDETMRYVKNAIFYLTTSRYEGLPLAVIEAMSLGKCIVASDVLGNKDCVKDGYNGYLLPLQESLFAKKIIELIGHPNLTEAYGKNSRLLFEKDFLIQNRIPYLETIYKTR